MQLTQPGDALEQQADRLADAALDGVAGERMSRRPTLNGPAQVSALPRSTQQALQIPGVALQPPLRARLEHGFGADLGDVRLHVGSAASRSARDLGAHAYTLGSDIVVGEDAARLGAEQGMRLVAHEVAHALQPEASGRVIARQAAAQLDFGHLAERIHTAIAGWGTDEEAVYLALQQCRRDASAIAQLEAEYQRRYNVSLEADIRDDFSGEELEYALQLMSRGRAGSPQGIGGAPAGPSQMESAAHRLHDAMEGWGTDEEAIYAALLPLNRDRSVIHDLMDTYQRLFNENPRERIIDEMSGSELDHALYLLGGAPVRARPEITEVTEQQAQQLFQELARLTFWTNTDALAPVPFHYPPDGCYARAHLMAERLTELGIASEKVFAISTAPGGLQVRSDFAADMPPGSQQQPVVQWWYHVAPVIRVRDAQGNVQEMVMDPSMFPGPVRIDGWTGRMRTDAFTRMTQEQIQRELQANRGIFPAGRNVVVTSSRDVYYPQDLARTPTAQDADAEMEAVRGRLTDYALYAQAHEVAAALRSEMRATPPDPNRIIAILTGAPSAGRSGLWMIFPSLSAWMLASFSEPDRTRVRTALFAP